MRRIALMLALAGCGGKKDPAPKATASADAGPAASNPVDAQATPDEVVHAFYYRAPDGTAALRYAALDDDRWTSTLTRGAAPSIRFTARDATIQVWFPARADQPLVAEQVAKEAAAMLGGTITGSKPIGAGAFILNLAGTPPSTVLATVDGTAAALVIATATDAVTKEAWFTEGFKTIVDGLKVGSQQPEPPPADPGKPLAGVYIHARALGGYDALVFDPRGYVHTDDDLVADLDAIWAIRDGKLPTYTFDGKNVAIGTRKGTLDHNTLTIDGDDYCSATGRVPSRIAGHWALVGGGATSANASDTFNVRESGDYYMTKEGGYSFESFVAADLTNTPGGKGPIKPEVHAQGGGGDHGTYDIRADRLYLTGADGTKAVRSIYGAGCDADAKDRTGVLYLGGDIYLHED